MFYCDICDSAFLSLNRVHGLKVNACISYLRVPWMSEVFSLEQHQLREPDRVCCDSTGQLKKSANEDLWQPKCYVSMNLQNTSLWVCGVVWCGVCTRVGVASWNLILALQMLTVF